MPKEKKIEIPERVTTAHEQRLVGLVLGSRMATNNSDFELLKQIEEIEVAGRIVEIPSEFV